MAEIVKRKGGHMDEQTNRHTDGQAVSRLDIIYIFRAYNRHEFSWDEFIEQTRAWSEAMRRQMAGRPGLIIYEQ